MQPVMSVMLCGRQSGRQASQQGIEGLLQTCLAVNLPVVMQRPALWLWTIKGADRQAAACNAIPGSMQCSAAWHSATEPACAQERNKLLHAQSD